MRGNLGHVYLLSNPALVGIVKIGYTNKVDASIRAVELSASTSIPLPFVVESSWLVENPAQWESRIHTRLAFCRVSRDREFFRIDTSEAEKHINLLLHGTDDLGEAVIREIRSMASLYRKYPDSFKHADTLVAKIEQILGSRKPA